MEGKNYHKLSGYSAQKKYNATHPEIKKKADAAYSAKQYSISVSIPRELKPILDGIMHDTGMNARQVFLSAVEEKYGVVLHKEKK